MKVAIMQPYAFPYVGYFQMIKAVDHFVFYDDVNFIKNGWINRNRIIVNNEPNYISIPCKNISSFKKINEIEIYSDLKDYKVLAKKIEQSYKKAPYFETVFPIIFEIIENKSRTISEFAIKSIISFSHFLEIDVKFYISSIDFPNCDELDRNNRLYSIVKSLNGIEYINAIGGQELYQKEDFKAEGIDLKFIKSNPIHYKQFNNEFIPWLSIIDVMMFNSPEEVHRMLDQFELI